MSPILTAVAISVGFQSVPPTPLFVRSAAKRLTSPATYELSRLSAAVWFGHHAAAKPTVAGTSALAYAARNDLSPAVRVRAVEALGVIATANKQPCPDAVLGALTDSHPQVFEAAIAVVGQCGRLTPAGVSVLTRVAESNNPERRWIALNVMGFQAASDPNALAAIRHGMRDSCWKVSRAAHLALYWATRKIDEAVPFVLRQYALMPGVDTLPPNPTPADVDAAVFVEAAGLSDYIILGSAMAEQPEEAVRVLSGMMARAGDPVTRLAAVQFLNWCRPNAKHFCPLPVREQLRTMAIEDPDPRTRTYAWRVIGRLPPLGRPE